MSGTASSFASESDEWEPEEDFVEKPKRESICVVVMSSISDGLSLRFPASEAASQVELRRSRIVLYPTVASMATFTLVCRYLSSILPPLSALY